VNLAPTQEEKKMASKDLDTNLQQYVELRTLLDSLESGALRYYLNAANQTEQEEHYHYLTTKLGAINNHIWTKKAGIACPDGYVECNGCCVPYNCVIGSDPK
jgi:bacterioferritin (cytochrome b1)